MRRRGAHLVPRRHRPRPAVCVVVVAAALMALSCGGGTRLAGGPTSSSRATLPAPTTTTQLPGVDGAIAALLPPVQSPESARTLESDCGAAGLPGTVSMPDPPPSAVFRAADGSYLRRYGGINPRVEVSSVPFDTPPTDAQRAAAAAFVARVRAVVTERGWDDPANVVRDGFRQMQPCNSHYVNTANVLDGVSLDPERPEFVVIEAGADHRPHVRSIMFLAPTPTGHGPQLFGTLAIWHYHEGGSCMIEGMIEVPQQTSTCPTGSERFDRSPEMLHITLSGPPFDPSM